MKAIDLYSKKSGGGNKREMFKQNTDFILEYLNIKEDGTKYQIINDEIFSNTMIFIFPDCKFGYNIYGKIRVVYPDFADDILFIEYNYIKKTNELIGIDIGIKVNSEFKSLFKIKGKKECKQIMMDAKLGGRFEQWQIIR